MNRSQNDQPNGEPIASSIGRLTQEAVGEPIGDILVVDDSLPSLRVLSSLLAEQGHQVRSARDGPTGLMMATADPPDLICLDVNMPEMNGFEVCRNLKNSPETRDVPVIFVSALDEVVDKLKGFEVGGVDYITKPFDIDEVRVRVKTHLTRYQLQNELGRRNAQLQQEIHERVQAQAALQAREDMLKAQYDGIPVPTYTWQRSEDDFVLVDYNIAAVTITQGKISDFLGTKASEMYKDRPDILEDFARCLANNCSFEREMEYHFITAKETKNLAVKYAFVPPDLVLVHTEDITARRQAEDALQERTDELDRRVKDLSAVNRIAQIVATTVDLQEILTNTAETVTDLFAARATIISVPDNDYAELRVLAGSERTSGTFTTDNQLIPLAEMSLTRQVLVNGQTRSISDLLTLPMADSVQTQLTDWDLHVILAVPLKAHGEVIGLLAIGLDEPDREFSSEEVVLAETIAGDIAGAIETAQLAEQARVAAIDAERHRLARELHDSVTQSLYSSILLSTGWRNMVMQGTLEDPAGAFEQIIDLGQQTLKDMRLLLYQLRPTVLEEEGLVRALQQRLENVEGRSNIESQLLTQGDVENLPHAIEDQLFYIAQEALNNSLRHAFASEVIVQINVDDDSVVLSVEDDGQGFDTNKETSGMGLLNMHERAESLHGQLTIASEPEGGARVEVSVELDQDQPV